MFVSFSTDSYDRNGAQPLYVGKVHADGREKPKGLCRLDSKSTAGRLLSTLEPAAPDAGGRLRQNADKPPLSGDVCQQVVGSTPHRGSRHRRQTLRPQK